MITIKTKKILLIVLCFVLLLGCLSVLAGAQEAESAASEAEHEWSAYNGKKIGVLTGSIHDAYAKECFPDSEFLYYTKDSDLVVALMGGNIDGFTLSRTTIYQLIEGKPGLTLIDEPIDFVPTAIAFPKTDDGAALREEFNEFLREKQADGTLEQLKKDWLESGSKAHAIDMTGFDPHGKKLVFATTAESQPYTYYYEGKPVGFEVELVVQFCRAYGYQPDIQAVDFSGIISGLTADKYDVAANAIAITEERKEMLYFSDVVLEPEITLAVRKDSSERFFTAVSELNDPNVVIGTLLGSNFEAYRNTAAPKAQLKYFNTTSDLLFALSVGQIDSVLIDDLMARYLSANVEGLTYLEEPIEPIQGQAFIFGNTEFDTKLMAQMNEFTAKLQQDGTLNELIFKWCRSEAADADAAYDTEGPNGTIRIATNAENPPGVYLSNGKIVGYEPEILSLFCKEYGYGMEFTDMNFPGIIPAVLSGQCNIGAATISVTEERKETVRFAEAYYSAGGLALIRKPVEKAGFFQGIAASFERTFLRESRWKLILEGVCTTVVISVCAAALGTVLGFGLCLLRRSKSRFLQGLTTVYIRIMQGMPLLVLVMILFYIVFAKAGLNGVTVAIFAFALSFAAYVCEIIRTGIDGVEPGQTEAALALGYTKTQSFLKIVLPQAARNFLPVYQGEFISLVKMTSIVGYIAVEDLTKMSDIIRSRTYEAFFPLITTAILYFLISMALTSLLRLAARKLEPRRTVKGVKLQ